MLSYASWRVALAHAAFALLASCAAARGEDPAPPRAGLDAGAPEQPADLPVLTPAARAALASSTRLLVVISDSWSATPAKLTLYAREGSGFRRLIGPLDGAVGSNGMSWGRGLTEPPPGTTHHKREGDRTSPAGLFRLGQVMGYAAPPEGVVLPYRRSTSDLVCVDDPESPRYNTLQSTRPGPLTWKSSEPMVPGDDSYELLALIDHNALVQGRPIPGEGSCIFLHVWGGPGSSTIGCTALAHDDLAALLRALPSLETTVLVQMPRVPYREAGALWHLPPLDG